MQNKQTRTLTLNKGRQAGKQIVTPYSDAEALVRLQHHVDQGRGNDFAHDLCRRGMRCSESQIFWVHVLVLDLDNPPRPYPNIIASYTRGREAGVAQRSMKLPVGRVEEGMHDGAVVQLSIAGKASRYTGQVWVMLPETDTYCGRIDFTGTFYKVGDCPDEVLPVLERVDDNVAEVLPW